MNKARLNIATSKLVGNSGQLDWLPRNPRTWTAGDLERTKRSIERDPDFLEDRPLLVVPAESGKGERYIVFGGNLRLKACRENGVKTAPAVIYFPETDEDRETVKRRAMLDNGSFGSWDYDALANEWDDLPLVDLGIPAWEPEQDADGFGAGEEGPAATEDDFDADADVEEGRTKRGDIWELGSHRLMCGDATDAKDVARLIDGAAIDLSLTDPPYGISIVKSGKIGGDKPATFGKEVADKQGKLIGDYKNLKQFGKKVTEDEFIKANIYHEIKGDDTTETARLSYLIMKDVSKNQVIFGGNYFTDFLPPHACWVVWDKMNGNSVFADVELAWTSFDKGARLFAWMWNGMARAGDRATEGVKRIHPTQKPVGLYGKILDEFSKEGDRVLDLFAGSGTLAIAAEQAGRVAYMMEIEPYYCDVIIARWEKLTGKKATKIAG